MPFARRRAALPRRQRWHPLLVLAALALATAGFFIARDFCKVHDIAVPRLAIALFALLVGAGCVAAVRACRNWQHGTVLVVLGLCGAAIGGLLPPAPGGAQRVELTATGERNPEAKGSEVWALDVVPGRVHMEGPGWEHRDGRVSVSWQSQPSTAVLKGPWRQGDVLRLVTHAYSGIVELKADGRTERIDLYSAEQGAIMVTLPAPRANLARTVLHGTLPVLLLLALAALLLYLPRPWAALLLTGAVLGTATLWHLQARSYPGALELLAYGDAELARLEGDIGNGSFEIPAGNTAGARAVSASFAHPGADSLHLRAASGTLEPVPDVSETGMRVARSGAEGEPLCEQAEPIQLFRWLGDRSRPLLLDGAGNRTALWTTAGLGDAGQPGYVVVVCDGASVRISATTAYIRIDPWAQPWWQLREVRAEDAAGQPMPLLQLSAERPAGFVGLAAASNGAYAPVLFDRPDTRAIAIEKLVAAIVVALLPAMLWLALTNFAVLRRHWVPGTRLLALLCFTLPPLWIGATMMVLWPGTIGWDAYSPYIQMHAGTVTLWYGIGYPLLIGGLALLMAPALIGVAQCIVMALVVQAVTVRCLDARPGLRWVGLATCLALPLTIVAWGATVHLRDAMNGTLMALFGIGWFYTVVDGQRWRRGRRGLALGLLAALALGLVLLRIDNIVFVGVALMALPLLVRGVRRRLLAFAVAMVVLCLGINPAMEQAVFGSREGLVAEKNFYRQTAFISPLVGYLADPDSRLSAQQKEALARDLAPLFDLKAAVSHWKPHHVIWWHEAVEGKPAPTAEQIASLQRHYIRTALQDPLRFLRMRAAMFLSTLGHKWIAVPPVPAAPGAQVLLDRLTMPHDAQAGATARLIGFDPALRPWPALAERLFRFADAVATTLPQLVICIVMLFCVRWTPVAAVLALALLGRAAVFFFFAPADALLYLFDLHVLGFLLPGMAVYELSRRRPRVSIA
ncbi:hypothetical protein [Cupriavidus sp. AU9028]|uniref:hypothetical protein n=1 Tax=Cupriavidus sp. AU9028 TaxID=2871157 RepID=UPI001C94CE3B|nr:hypothetical protein [Cupriavidus sp. AU9028]MBY4898124.1 hypothetical protein [Cupriavidus sp. AU9028]